MSTITISSSHLRVERKAWLASLPKEVRDVMVGLVSPDPRVDSDPLTDGSAMTESNMTESNTLPDLSLEVLDKKIIAKKSGQDMM